MGFPAIERIETARLAIRPVREADLPDLMQVNGDEQVTRFLPYAAWQAPADASAWLTRMDALATGGTGRQFVLEHKADAVVVGTLLLFRHEPASRRIELGYVLGRGHWGKGLMHEALGATCTALFRDHGLRRIEAEVNPANAASCRLVERLGFMLEGRLRQRWEAKGAVYDTHLYACLAQDWNAASGESGGAW